MAHPKLRAAILIVSDTASADPTTDKCIPVLEQGFGDAWEILDKSIVPDSVESIQGYIKKWSDSDEYANCIITSGGTGFAVKDNTPEAVTPLIHKFASGLVHAMLAPSLAITPFAMMGRPVAGVRNSTVIVTLPGSPKGAKENLEAIVKLLPHACQQAAGSNSRAMHAGGIKQLEKDAGVSSGASPSHSHRHHHHHHDHSHGHGHAVPRAHTSAADHPVPNDPSAGPSRRHRKSPYPMLSVNDALDLIKVHVPKPIVQTATVSSALLNHTLASSISAPEPVPAFRASIVDGYAVRFPDSGSFESGVYPVALVSHAQPGEVPELTLGTVARITTGAPLPPGADAVVMVEDTLLDAATEDGREEASIKVLTSEIKKGENVREVGSDVAKGAQVLAAGQRISALGGEFGLLASIGVEKVEVFRKPIIGVLSTGDELVEHTATGLKYGQVRDTNRPTLLSAIAHAGYEGVDLGIARDASGTLEEAVRGALRKVDVLITTGGVSMGELDLLKPTVVGMGGTVHFGRVSMKPGKPTTFASVVVKDNSGDERTKIVFGLPGNPASAVVTFELFVLPAVGQMAGDLSGGLARVKVVLEEDVRADMVREEYVRAIVSGRTDGKLGAVSTGGQRSSRIGSFGSANALLKMPVGVGMVKKGETVEALLMGTIGGMIY